MVKILFVCEYNACRSQMAEGLARHLLPKMVVAQSAGLYPGEVNALTIEVMREIGIDIASHRSKRLPSVADLDYDYMVVLAEPVADRIQGIRAKERLLWPYPDPVKEPGEANEIKAKIRKVRDDLKVRIEEFSRNALRDHRQL